MQFLPKKKFTGARGTLTTPYLTLFILLLLVLWLYYEFYDSPMHSTSTMWCFRIIGFFFCLEYRLAWKKSKLNNLIHGGFGSTWGHNFCTGMQNGSKLEIWPERILIYSLELKLQPFEVFPYVCIVMPFIYNVFRPCAKWGAWLRRYINATTFTHFGQNHRVEI